MTAKSDSGPMVVTHEGGARFAIQVRSHRIIVDQPADGGGEDAAPMPLELLGAALGSCVALYVQRFCVARGLVSDGMRVEVRTENAQHPNRVARFDVRVCLAQPIPLQYAAILERVVRSCPAHNTLAHGAEVDIEIHDSATCPEMSHAGDSR
jgi:uncharacterized OsmC-like protein